MRREYLDLEIEEPLNPQEFIDRLNSCLPEGIVLIDAKERKTKENIMASVVAASYKILVASELNYQEARDLIEKIYAAKRDSCKKTNQKKN